MPQINWKADFSLGNIITIITLLIGIGASYASVRAEIASLDRRQTVTESRLEKLSTADEAQRAQFAAIERDLVRTVTRLETLMIAMSADIARLTRQVEERAQRP